MAIWLLAAPLSAADVKKYTYLALGDSIPFGFDPTLFANNSIPTPGAFIGYPEVVGSLQAKTLLNAACPGETSASFLVFGAPDNGCNGLGPQGQPPFKSSIGLKATYPKSQMEFAVAQLQVNKDVNLVTLSIGGNDLSLLQAACAPQANFRRCVLTRLPRVLGAYGAQLTQILTGIRREYNGRLVLMTNYSPSSDPLVTGAVAALNVVMIGVGSQFGVRVADGFGAFRTASEQFGGDPCAAGLLVRLSATSCDIHPSALGRSVLAETVRRIN